MTCGWHHASAWAAVLYSLPMSAVAAASAVGWLLAYLGGPDIVRGWIEAVAGDNRIDDLVAVALNVARGLKASAKSRDNDRRLIRIVRSSDACRRLRRIGVLCRLGRILLRCRARIWRYHRLAVG